MSCLVLSPAGTCRQSLLTAPLTLGDAAKRSQLLTNAHRTSCYRALRPDGVFPDIFTSTGQGLIGFDFVARHICSRAAWVVLRNILRAPSYARARGRGRAAMEAGLTDHVWPIEEICHCSPERAELSTDLIAVSTVSSVDLAANLTSGEVHRVHVGIGQT
jgi:hypothetical protein